MSQCTTGHEISSCTMLGCIRGQDRPTAFHHSQELLNRSVLIFWLVLDEKEGGGGAGDSLQGLRLGKFGIHRRSHSPDQSSSSWISGRVGDPGQSQPRTVPLLQGGSCCSRCCSSSHPPAPWYLPVSSSLARVALVCSRSHPWWWRPCPSKEQQKQWLNHHRQKSTAGSLGGESYLHGSYVNVIEWPVSTRRVFKVVCRAS